MRKWMLCLSALDVWWKVCHQYDRRPDKNLFCTVDDKQCAPGLSCNKTDNAFHAEWGFFETLKGISWIGAWDILLKRPVQYQNLWPFHRNWTVGHFWSVRFPGHWQYLSLTRSFWWPIFRYWWCPNIKGVHLVGWCRQFRVSNILRCRMNGSWARRDVERYYLLQKVYFLNIGEVPGLSIWNAKVALSGSRLWMYSSNRWGETLAWTIILEHWKTGKRVLCTNF